MAYINSELTDEKMELVKNWINKTEENKNHFSELEKTWKMSGSIEPKPVVVDVDKAWNSVFKQIEPQQKVIDINRKKSSITLKYILAVAAMLVVVFTVFKLSNSTELENVNLLAEHTILTETLDDGSIITLNENSMLSYPENFSKTERRVNLKGEAFFDIERNEKKPFIIDLPHNQYVKVLGTSFNIKALDNDSLTTVYVSTGKVEFGDKSNKIILVAGETGVINNKTNAVYKMTDSYSDLKNRYWQNQYLNFKGENLSEVITVLNDIFEDQTIIECQSTNELAISSTFDHKSLDYILDVITQTNELDLQIDNSGEIVQYTISCNED